MRSKLLATAVIAALGAVSISAHAAPGDTTLGGKMFVDFSNITQKDSDSGKTAKTGTGFDVNRFYLSVTHQFDDIWSVNLTTDFNYVSNDGETNVFVKKAYVQGKFSDMAVLRVGSADMPWIPFVEDYYGFRYVEPTVTDRNHFANSADWGAHLQGKGGMFNYSAAIVNGGGYKHPGRSKGVDFEGRVGFSPMDGMIVAVGAYSGKLGKDTQTLTTPTNTASRVDGMVAYASKQFRVGGEYFQVKNWGNAVTGQKDKADGYSVWGSAKVADGIEAFVRYDKTNLSKDLDPSKKGTYYNAGVQFAVTKGFKLAAVYKHEKTDYSSPLLPVHVANIKTDEIGVWGEVKF